MSSSRPNGPPSSTTVLRIVGALIRPIERFVHVEAASGLVLFATAVIALAWANSPWRGTYVALWETPIHLAAIGHEIAVTGHFVVNDALMALFFLVVGLEIRRETHRGELSSLRASALPVFAAVGGMVVPAAIYLAISGAESARGWGIPIATDIAFALGVLELLGRRVPPPLRVMLLALAIFDDLGAIVVITIFYSTGLEAHGLVLALAGVLLIVGLQWLGARRAAAYVPAAALLWFGMHEAGIHPAIAGVIVGLLTPVSPARGDHEGVSPGERLERALHPWVAFGVMPVFALANAGLDLHGLGAGSLAVGFGVASGLVIGKPLGILGASAIMVKSGIAALPRGITWRDVLVLGIVAGNGFTMSLFMAELAFVGRPDLHGTAKLAVLVASMSSALLALVLARALRPRAAPARARRCAPEHVAKEPPHGSRR